MWKKCLAAISAIIVVAIIRSNINRQNAHSTQIVSTPIPAPVYDDNSPCYFTKELKGGSRISVQIFCHADKHILADSSVICAYNRDLDSITFETMGVGITSPKPNHSTVELLKELTHKDRMSSLGDIDSVS